MTRALPFFLVAVAACGSPIKTGLTDQSWRRVTTAHVVVRTDAPQQRAMQRAREFERYWQRMFLAYRLLSPTVLSPKEKFQIILLTDCRDFKTAFPDARGVVVRDWGLTSQRVAVVCDARMDGREVVIHEMVHLLNRHHLAGAPVWLNEGLATYLQTIVYRDEKQLFVGALSFYDRQFWARGGSNVSLQALLGIPRDKWNKEKSRRYYYAAWKLVHLLQNSLGHRDKFRAYLTGLAAGVPSTKAWRVSFGKSPDLEEQFEDYEKRSELGYWGIAYQESPQAPRVEVTPMAATAAYMAWAGLLRFQHKHEVERQIASAEKEFPAWDGHLYWRAVHALDANAEDKIAAERLAEYATRHPDDPAALHGVVVTGHAQPRATAEAAANALETVASAPGHFEALADYHGQAGHKERALQLAKRAVDLAPGSPRAWSVLANAYFLSADVANALICQRRAIAMLGKHATDEDFKRLKVYEQAR